MKRLIVLWSHPNIFDISRVLHPSERPFTMFAFSASVRQKKKRSISPEEKNQTNNYAHFDIGCWSPEATPSLVTQIHIIWYALNPTAFQVYTAWSWTSWIKWWSGQNNHLPNNCAHSSPFPHPIRRKCHPSLQVECSGGHCCCPDTLSVWCILKQMHVVMLVIYYSYHFLLQHQSCIKRTYLFHRDTQCTNFSWPKTWFTKMFNQRYYISQVNTGEKSNINMKSLCADEEEWKSKMKFDSTDLEVLVEEGK